MHRPIPIQLSFHHLLPPAGSLYFILPSPPPPSPRLTHGLFIALHTPTHIPHPPGPRRSRSQTIAREGCPSSVLHTYILVRTLSHRWPASPFLFFLAAAAATSYTPSSSPFRLARAVVVDDDEDDFSLSVRRLAHACSLPCNLAVIALFARTSFALDRPRTSPSVRWPVR
ncbi:hypothetical protein PYCCODRAFT_606841 [Trametes coccinea BRFM310]|uniref:Uncharacterized protein n=1 Tax=Trametes coccinea (strain BRFM310) TaxID=1353009 RepID=A0A1Y2J1X6_TRAC3|nr:hypothetical protein PYCCODRAFT_606841 [Trametes coccinea BRFM310]